MAGSNGGRHTCRVAGGGAMRPASRASVDVAASAPL